MTLPKPLKHLLTGLAVFISVFIIIFLALYISLQDRNKKDVNPYEYNIDAFKSTPLHWLLYKEVKQISLDLKKPKGIAVDSREKIFVIGDKNILVIKKDGTLLNKFNITAPAECLTVDKNNDIILGVNDHIEVYDKNGIKKFTSNSMGEKAFLTSIAVKENHIFIADYGNSIIWHYDRSGKLLSDIKCRDSAQKIQDFILPSPHFDLASGIDNSVWIVDPGRHTLGNYTYEGRLLKSWGKAGMNIDGFSGCCNPIHIAVGPQGDLFTTEKGLARVKVYNSAGEFKGFVAGTEYFKPDTIISDLTVDPYGRVMILDPVVKAVRIFEKK